MDLMVHTIGLLVLYIISTRIQVTMFSTYSALLFITLLMTTHQCSFIPLEEIW